ncbi:MAG: glycosyltransferase [Terriglobales bacterium]
MNSAVEDICIGIIADAAAERLRTTIVSLEQTCAGRPYRLILLADRPEPDIAVLIAEYSAAGRAQTASAEGGAACFNRLVESATADLYVLLENGLQFADGWLDHLLAAFRNYPQCGLAGPSTNRAWNQQCLFPTARDDAEEVRRIGLVTAHRFGRDCRSLQPLYSLSDFCYAVRREVVARIGGTDERYGQGPCWEMDYNIRAARAGFQGLWVCAAYVQRAMPSARRQRDESEHFDASKRLYQDKFCGLHLRGLKRDYRPHCRGDACPNFAPAELIHIGDVEPAATAVRISVSPAPPLVSCIMPTANRRRFLPRSMRCFFQQDYPNLELVIVDDGDDPIADLLPPDPRLRYFRLPEKQTVGSKRNFACSQARGDIVIHWDDDDWYAAFRVRRQVTPLLEERGLVSGTSTIFYYHAENNEAFRYEYQGSPVAWLGGIAYWKHCWERHPFGPAQVGEDVLFLAAVPAASRVDLRDLTLCVAALHDSNASKKITSGSFWQRHPTDKIHEMLGAEAGLPGPGAYAISTEPLVSCVMPTHNRRGFIPLALSCYRNQTYLNRELIVVDDGVDRVGDLLCGDPSVRYIRCERRMTIGAKRNLAVEHARGEFIAHWDDDDWYAPQRLSCQVQPMRDGRCDLTGLVNTFTLEMPAGQFWNVTESLHRRMFVGNVHGGTLAFRRALWISGVRYPETDLAEDAALIRRATERGNRLERLANNGVFVYLRHERNAWKFDAGSFLDPNGWAATAPPPGFSAELLEAYRAAACGAGAIMQPALV